MTLRVCPRVNCAELNEADAVTCIECGARLIEDVNDAGQPLTPSERTAGPQTKGR